MLRIFHKMKDLDFEKLMAVYEEGNLENAQEFYPDEEPSTQILFAERDFMAYLQEDFFATKGAFYAVWEENGAYVAALRMEPYQEGLLIEALETAPSQRRKGYAKELICAVLSQLSAPLCIYSHVGKKNTASLKTHISCGFARIQEHAVYVDGTVSSNACTMRKMI